MYTNCHFRVRSFVQVVVLLACPYLRPHKHGALYSVPWTLLLHPIKSVYVIESIEPFSEHVECARKGRKYSFLSEQVTSRDCLVNISSTLNMNFNVEIMTRNFLSPKKIAIYYEGILIQIDTKATSTMYFIVQKLNRK